MPLVLCLIGHGHHVLALSLLFSFPARQKNKALNPEKHPLQAATSRMHA